MAFFKQKTQRLEHADLSRKGSVDSAIQELVNLINAMPQYFTTSSCSGRIILFENISGKLQKKGCKWLHVSHQPVQVENILKALENITDEAVFKFEPMVMHMQCQSLDDARKMHQVAVAAGFRNSGITVGTKGKIMMAVRSTHSLEVPLSSNGEVLVSPQFLKYLTESANSKMEENFARIQRFEESVKLLTAEGSSSCQVHTCEKTKRKLPVPNKGDSSSHTCDSSVKPSSIEEDHNMTSSDEEMSLFVFDGT